MLLTLEYQNCCTNKLHQELLEQITENFAIQSDDVTTFITFIDIRKSESIDEQEQPVITYQKRRVEIEPIEEGSEETHEVTYWDDYTEAVTNPIDAEPKGLIAQIDAIVAVHDPTPLPVPKTELEIQKENNAILWVEIQRIKGEV